jgi:hypothetical protein
MNIPNQLKSRLCRIGLCAAILLCIFSAQANPISIPEKSVTPEITVLVTGAILLEAAVIICLLRRFQKPRLFILWLIGMQLITYPGFLGLIWLLQDMRPALAVATGETVVVIVEGVLIYLICRWVPAKQNPPTASLWRCWLASLVGNTCSLLAFPVLTQLYDAFSRA